MATLCILAHQDDEIAMAVRISRRTREGKAVFCAFLTDGSGNRSDPRIRDDESRLVLGLLGVPPENVLFIGSKHGIPDGGLARNLDRAYELLDRATRSLPVDEVLCLAWEGGHPDHDASHLIALALAHDRGLARNVWQFPIYRGPGAFGAFFRVMAPLSPPERDSPRISLRDGFRLASLCWRYRSQRRSWLGIFPGTLYKLAIVRRDLGRPADREAVWRRPHDGTLFYEKRYGVAYAEVAAAAADFLGRRLPPRLPG